MRVSINRREEIIGLPGSIQHYYVDCTSELTEEEKTLIRGRSLEGWELITGPGAVAASRAPFYFNLTGRFAVMMAILVLALGYPLVRRGHPEVLIAGLVAGAFAAGLSLSAAVLRRINIRQRAADQTITLGDLVRAGNVSIVVSTVAQADAIEREIRSALAELNRLIRTEQIQGGEADPTVCRDSHHCLPSTNSPSATPKNSV
jgi:hypothetical protein